MTAAGVNPDPLAALRLKLRRAGYFPVPCEGKRPPLKGWQDKFATNADEISLWSKSWHMARNTGALARHSPALDIDLTDEDAAEAIETLVGNLFEDGRILVRIGKAPKRLIPFRTAAPFKKLILAVTAPNGVKAKLEFLGDGQQYIVDGVHPETRNAYCWHGADHLADVSARDLPLVRDDTHAQEVLDQIGAMLVAEHGYTLEPKQAQPNADHPRGYPADWSELTRRVLTGVDIHDAMVSLSASHASCGMPIEGSTRTLRALLLASALPRDERFRERINDVERRVRSGYAKFAPAAEQEATPDDTLHWHGDPDVHVERRWLVENLLPETGSALLSGAWGTYKTFVSFDLAASVITGTEFIDYPVARKGGVLFVAAEGGEEVPIRLQAIVEHRCGGNRVPFAWTTSCPSLLEPAALTFLANLARQANERMTAEFGVPLALIIVDTLISATAFKRAGDENDAAVMSTIMKQLAALSERTGALALAVDHYGKDPATGTRGSSSKEGAASTVLALLGERNPAGEVTDTRLAARKVRSGPSGREISFRPRLMDMGTDRNGRPVNTLTIEWTPRQAAKAPKEEAKGWTKSLHLLRRTLMNVLATDQASMQRPFADGPVVRAVDIEVVRGEFYRLSLAEGDAEAKHAARQKAFRRALNDAQARELIGLCEIGSVTFVWLANPNERGDPPAKHAWQEDP
jgi:AAA domain/Bifunctional DNA primase/polymerase, N-terminal